MAIPWTRALAGLAALIGWATLVLQFGLAIDRMTGEGQTVLAAIWRLVGYFTILTNLLVAVVATAIVVRPTGALAGPRLRLVTVTAIILVGLVYSIALRDVWNPTGWQAVADHGLHDVIPPLFLVVWLLTDHGRVAWRDIGWVLALPIGYCLYVYLRGAADGWYPYYFLDPGQLAASRLALNIALLAAGFLAVGLALIGIDRWMGRGRTRG
jgi:hypothetical protein